MARPTGIIRALYQGKGRHICDILVTFHIDVTSSHLPERDSIHAHRIANSLSSPGELDGLNTNGVLCTMARSLKRMICTEIRLARDRAPELDI